SPRCEPDSLRIRVSCCYDGSERSLVEPLPHWCPVSANAAGCRHSVWRRTSSRAHRHRLVLFSLVGSLLIFSLVSNSSGHHLCNLRFLGEDSGSGSLVVLDRQGPGVSRHTPLLARCLLCGSLLSSRQSRDPELTLMCRRVLPLSS